jgi:nudix motif 8
MAISQCSIRCIRAKLNVSPKFPILTTRQKDNALKHMTKLGISDTNPKFATKNSQRSAAVLVPICLVSGIPSILFTLRSNNVSSHKSEISFPGGHLEESDKSHAHAALREAQEELNGTYNYTLGVEILGETDWVPSASGTTVVPVVAAFTDEFRDEQHLQQVFYNSDDRREVERVFSRTLKDLIKSESQEPLPRLGSLSPIFPGKEGKIWGLTAFILRPLLHNIIVPAFQKP